MGFLAHNKVSCFVLFLICSLLFMLFHDISSIILLCSCLIPVLFLHFSYPVPFLSLICFLTCPYSHLSSPFPVRILFLSFYSPVPLFLLSCSSPFTLLFLSCSCLFLVISVSILSCPCQVPLFFSCSSHTLMSPPF